MRAISTRPSEAPARVAPLSVLPVFLDLHGKRALVAGGTDPARAQAFVDAARAAAVPVNVIDNPAYCQFQFGSVVNRSPVVVGISTTGAAPILGQAVRRRIETLLPRSLSQWAALAQTLRATVTERLAPGPARRTFWESLVDRAFGPAPDASAEANLL